MTTKAELETRAKALEAELAALNKAIESMPADKPAGGVWVPEKNEAYYYIASKTVFKDYWKGYENDECRLILGNVHRTEEDAKAWWEVQKVKHELRVAAGDFVPDWDDATQTKYGVNVYENALSLYAIIQIKDASVYLRSEKERQAAIDSIGEDRLRNAILSKWW